jgi:hypothetical protein
MLGFAERSARPRIRLVVEMLRVEVSNSVLVLERWKETDFDRSRQYRYERCFQVFVRMGIAGCSRVVGHMSVRLRWSFKV